MRIETHPAADQEVLDAAVHLEADRRGYGDWFLGKLDDVLELIVAYRKIGPRVSRRARKKRVIGFPYCVVYQILDDILYIVAIAHREPPPHLLALPPPQVNSSP